MMNHMSALRPASAVVSLVYLSLMSSCISVKALSHSTEAWCPRNRADRRSALLQISSLVCLPLVSSPLEASASEDGPKPFETYGIIPDAGPKLNPQLLKINSNDLIQRLASSEVGGSVWLGEHHNAVKDHQFQELFIRDLYAERQKKGGLPMAIGMEQVQVQFQSVLDDYVQHKISLETMKDEVQWEKRWMWNFEGYRGVFEAARDLNIRLLALNVDSEDLARVETGGYPELPMKQLRKYIKDPVGFGEFANARQFKTYVDYVIEPSYEIHQKLGLLQYNILGERLESEMPFRNFLSGRILWDEGMASAAHAWVSENRGGILVGLVGADHVKFRNGIPGRFARMSSPEVDCTTIVINPTLIDSRPSGSVSRIAGADSSKNPDIITLQLRYLKDDIPLNSEERKLAKSTGGVLPFADYIVVT